MGLASKGTLANLDGKRRLNPFFPLRRGDRHGPEIKGGKTHISAQVEPQFKVIKWLISLLLQSAMVVGHHAVKDFYTSFFSLLTNLCCFSPHEFHFLRGHGE